MVDGARLEDGTVKLLQCEQITSVELKEVAVHPEHEALDVFSRELLSDAVANAVP